jgi:hypothetical protein
MNIQKKKERNNNISKAPAQVDSTYAQYIHTYVRSISLPFFFAAIPAVVKLCLPPACFAAQAREMHSSSATQRKRKMTFLHSTRTRRRILRFLSHCEIVYFMKSSATFMLRRMLPATGRLHTRRRFGKFAGLRNITPVNELHLGAKSAEKYTPVLVKAP